METPAEENFLSEPRILKSRIATTTKPKLIKKEIRDKFGNRHIRQIVFPKTRLTHATRDAIHAKAERTEAVLLALNARLRKKPNNSLISL